MFSVLSGKGEMAWYVDPKYWHNGYAYEAGIAVIKYCFDELCMEMITAEIEESNTASRMLAQKLGFQLDNVLNESDFYGKTTDVAYYSIKNM